MGVESLVGGPHRVEVHNPEEMDGLVEEQSLLLLKDNVQKQHEHRSAQGGSRDTFNQANSISDSVVNTGTNKSHAQIHSAA